MQANLHENSCTIPIKLNLEARWPAAPTVEVVDDTDCPNHIALTHHHSAVCVTVTGRSELNICFDAVAGQLQLEEHAGKMRPFEDWHGM